jgi:alpha,alpha-trehalose phosphorylase
VKHQANGLLLLHYPYYLLYSSQVVKQADLVFALYLCGDHFDLAQKRTMALLA